MHCNPLRNRSHVVIERMLFSLEVLFKLATSFNHLEKPNPA
jgi:hypothetical protein